MNSKRQDLEDLYGIAKKAYAKTIDQKIQLEFLMKKLNDFGVEFLREDDMISEQTKGDESA